MNSKLKMVLTLLLMLACIGYTFYNFFTGRTEASMLIVACVVLGVPFVNILRVLIGELRK